jgi:hypothetical protein
LAHNHQIPTLNKMLAAINEDDSLPNFSKISLYRVLKHLNFKYVRKSRNSALIERNDIVCWRRRYLETIKYFRQLCKTINYLDETLKTQAKLQHYHWWIIQSNRQGTYFFEGLQLDKRNGLVRRSGSLLCTSNHQTALLMAVFIALSRKKIPKITMTKRTVLLFTSGSTKCYRY